MTKDKNTAKVRLLNAMNQFKLEVPAWILKLEGEMKKEWDGENRKAKRQASGGAAKPKAKAKKESAEGAGGGSMQMPSGPFNLKSTSQDGATSCSYHTDDLQSASQWVLEWLRLCRPVRAKRRSGSALQTMIQAKSRFRRKRPVRQDLPRARQPRPRR